VGQALIDLLFHGLRAALAAVSMLLIAVGLWLLVGVATVTLGLRSPALVLIGALMIAVGAFAGGGYISARYITPRSWVHPTVAAVILGFLYDSAFTTGDIGELALVLPIAAGAIGAAGAAVARTTVHNA
jgi:hypothetical protein